MTLYEQCLWSVVSAYLEYLVKNNIKPLNMIAYCRAIGLPSYMGDDKIVT